MCASSLQLCCCYEWRRCGTVGLFEVAMWWSRQLHVSIWWIYIREGLCTGFWSGLCQYLLWLPSRCGEFDLVYNHDKKYLFFFFVISKKLCFVLEAWLEFKRTLKTSWNCLCFFFVFLKPDFFKKKPSLFEQFWNVSIFETSERALKTLKSRSLIKGALNNFEIGF